MSDTQHTPGPWMTDDEHGPYILAQTTDSGHHGTVISFGVRNPSAGHHWPAIGTGGVSLAEAKANARLIAAAPDLLAACEELRRVFRVDAARHGQRGCEAILKSDAAIAKARGPH